MIGQPYGYGVSLIINLQAPSLTNLVRLGENDNWERNMHILTIMAENDPSTKLIYMSVRNLRSMVK